MTILRFFFLTLITVYSSIPGWSEVEWSKIDLSDWGINDINSIKQGRLGIYHLPEGDKLAVYNLSEESVSPQQKIAYSYKPQYRNGSYSLFDPLIRSSEQWSSSAVAFQRAPSSSSIKLVTGADFNTQLEFHYEKELSGFCGVALNVYDDKPSKNLIRFFDSREFNYISLQIDDLTPNAQLQLRISDRTWLLKDDSLPVGMLSNYLVHSEENTHLFVVPLKDLPNRINRNEIAQIVLLILGGKGNGVIKDLTFHKTIDTVTGLLPKTSTQSNEADKLNGLWVWNTHEFLNQKRSVDFLLKTCNKLDIKIVYLQIPSSIVDENFKSSDLKVLAYLISTLSSHGIETHALDGDKSFTLPENHNKLLNRLRQVFKYNNKVNPESRFQSIHLDVEPHLLKGFNSYQHDYYLKSLLDLFEQVAILTHEHSMAFGVDIPFWFDDSDPRPGYTMQVEHQERGRYMYEHIIDIVDSATLMDYRTTALGSGGIIAMARNELIYAEQAGKKIRIGLETISLPDETEYSFSGEPISDNHNSDAPYGFFVIKKTKEGHCAALIDLNGYKDHKHEFNKTDVLVWKINRKSFIDSSKITFSKKPFSFFESQKLIAEQGLNSFSSFSGFDFHDFNGITGLIKD